MMLEIISQESGLDVATFVADRLICSAPRTSGCDQTMSILCRTGTRNNKLADAIEIMRSALENPLSPSEISACVGLSTRQLERLFSRYLRSTPKSYYTKLRLENARSLLQQTSMKVIDVAFASGFNSPSHFSRLYKKNFGSTPYSERGVQGQIL
jgi:transcriptional regulator GlxA family with amidase domain